MQLPLPRRAPSRGQAAARTARRRALAVALVVLCAAGGLGLARGDRGGVLAVPAEQAAHLGAADPTLRPVLRHATRSVVTRIDDDLVKVTWFRGARAVATVGVTGERTLTQPYVLSHTRTGYGSPLSHLPVVLAALTALFLLVALQGPLRRLRTLDAAALAAFVVPTVLLDRGYLGPAEICGAVLLAFLATRGVAVAVRGVPAAGAGPSLLERLARRGAVPDLTRRVALVLLAITAMVAVTSTGVVDIAWANMEGATILLHGHLPYGHMPGDVIHGDTYGLPIYALYAPFAAIWPVPDDWTDATGSLVVGAIAAAGCAVGLLRVAGGARWAAVLALVAFPATLMTFSSGTNDVLIAAAVIWAFAWFARPALSSALLMTAGLAKVAPLLLLPVWVARLRGAALLRALAACAAVGAVVLAGLVAVGGVHGPADMLHAMSFQAGRRSVSSIWTSYGLQALQPLVQAAAVAAALGGAVLVLGDRDVARDPRRIAGLFVAILALLQLAANHWTPLYLAWLLPPAILALLGPAAVAPADPPSPAASAPVAPPAAGRIAA
ncbi:hypothetical protein FSW04_09540 [Baekduia soli]|uniref:DUF2029 domain-containing protein n=1 Tax=Baekduia soli TaxID=496014 RepID=A0A5B8U497_9ACTN|nr:hypothetical protein [Baekduia soli]QEC47787.1 hypothetical protein FSW04_09540 [Baekduia soli]